MANVTQPKFTPGPWTVAHHGGERHLEAPNADCSLMCDMDYYPWTPDKDEDWNLIAAAPDMYAALEEAEALVVGWACHHAMQGAKTSADYDKATTAEGWHSTHRAIYEHVTAALKKAGRR